MQILKTKQRIRSEKHNVFTEEMKIALSSNNNRIHSIDSVDKNGHVKNWKRKMYVKKKKINITISWNNAKNDGLWSCYKRKQNNNSNWPQIPVHPY